MTAMIIHLGLILFITIALLKKIDLTFKTIALGLITDY
jgi:hypothetical protein